MISSDESPSIEKLNNSDCNDIFFFIESSVEKILSLCVVTLEENGSDFDSNSKCTPSGLITDICNNGLPEYSDSNS